MATEITAADVESLAAKLDGLELTESEGALLDAILASSAMGGDDVAGYGGPFFKTESLNLAPDLNTFVVYDKTPSRKRYLFEGVRAIADNDKTI